jgi:hypothetical protein
LNPEYERAEAKNPAGRSRRGRSHEQAARAWSQGANETFRSSPLRPVPRASSWQKEGPRRRGRGLGRSELSRRASMPATSARALKVTGAGWIFPLRTTPKFRPFRPRRPTKSSRGPKQQSRNETSHARLASRKRVVITGSQCKLFDASVLFENNFAGGERPTTNGILS